MNSMVKNLETGKIELHFDKAEYSALPESAKSQIKSAFLWSNSGKCWVSRAKEPNTWRAEQVAKALGFGAPEKVGERLSYAEQLERQAERAERRADRYEEHAENAERRAEALQSDINGMRGDIAFFTQPIIAGHAGSQAFARRRQRMFDRYDQGFEEYRKSEYYQDRARTARATADMARLSDPVYLDNRIRESNKKLRDMQKGIVYNEEVLYKIRQGEALKSAYTGEPITIEALEERMEDLLDRYEQEQDKLNFFEDCMAKLGGVQFSKENIRPGDEVEMRRWGVCEIVSAGPVNVKIRTGHGGVLTESYAAIVSVVKKGGGKAAAETIANPYAVGDILCLHRPADNSVYRAFQVTQATEKSVLIRAISVENGVPQAGHFKEGRAEERRRIVKSKYSDFVGAYYDDWQLHKYAAKPAQDPTA